MRRRQKFLLSLISLILIVSVVVFAALLQQTHRELRGFQERETAMQKRLDELESQHRAKKTYLATLENNPEFLERVVRERLGYSRADDLIYRFPE